MKKERIEICIASIAILVIFLLMNNMTPHVGVFSGNGNSAIIIVVPSLSVFGHMVFIWVRVFSRYYIRTSAFLITIMAISLHWVGAIIYQMKIYAEYQQILADAYENKFGFIDWEYIHQISSVLSIHVNNQYFNLNTYFMFITLSIFFGLSIVFIKKHIIS